MSILGAPNLDHLWGSLIVEELIRCGVDYFCIAPGSRSSALTASVALNKKAQTFIHFDERGLAFHALGTASATGKPVVIITTSGTAVANLFPAVIEASKKKLPLIILTADRPPELRNTGAHQTIDQVKIFGDYTRFAFDMPTPTQDITPEFVLTTIDQAVGLSQGELKGPVHINCMFREPLTPTKTKENFTQYTRHIKKWSTSGKPFTTCLRASKKLTAQHSKDIQSALGKIKNGLIVVGKLSTEAQRRSVLKLAHKLNWPILPDITSGLRLGTKEKNVIHHYDQLLLSDALRKKIQPDGILHIGGRITSKRYYQLIEDVKPAHYIMSLNHPLRNDPLHQVTLRIHAPIEEACKAGLATAQRKPTKLLTDLLKANKVVEQNFQKIFRKLSFLHEFAPAQIISEHIPAQHAMFLASSLPVREMDMFATAGFNHVELSSNRGASGIDGTIASACGYSVGHNKPVTVLIGDLACLYDLNSLSMVRQLKNPMTIVLLNNDGGGIFSFLPIAQHKEYFEKYFSTPHGLEFSKAADMFNLNYAQPKTYAEMEDCYKRSLTSKQSTLIEVKTEKEDNTRLQQQISKELNSLIK